MLGLIAAIDFDQLGTWASEQLGSVDTMGTGGVAAALGVVWCFMRVVRTVVSVLIAACVIYLVLRLGLGLDIMSYFS